MQQTRGPIDRSAGRVFFRVLGVGISAPWESTSEHFSPHVNTGIAPSVYLDKLLAEPFEPFIFSPAGAAVYQLGQFGTAAKRLHDCGLTR
jgi:hypothetical protein